MEVIKLWSRILDLRSINDLFTDNPIDQTQV